MRKQVLGGLVLLSIAGGDFAIAQVTVDIAKITCEQFWFRRVVDPDKVAIWISGYFNGKKDNTTVDLENSRELARQLTEYCRVNFKDTVMQAANAVMRADGK
jgi:hypothetical protein